MLKKTLRIIILVRIKLKKHNSSNHNHNGKSLSCQCFPDSLVQPFEGNRSPFRALASTLGPKPLRGLGFRV